MPTTIHDPRFQRTITLADAYRILERFVIQYNDRGETTTVSLMSDIGIVTDGSSSDPAQVDDFLNVVGEVLGPGAAKT